VSFLNKKQDVMKIKLTRFGKKQLAKGILQPKYYQFFDDNIIYDGNYGGVTEDQNNIQSRISEDLTLDAQPIVVSVEESHDVEMNRRLEEAGQDASPLSYFKELRQSVSVIEEEKILSYPLSTIIPGASQAPKFLMSSFDTLIQNSESLSYITHSGIDTRIPQIDFRPKVVLTRNTLFQVQDQNQLYDFETSPPDFSSTKVEFLDKSFLELDIEKVSITLNESLVPFKKENFTIEVYEVIEPGTANETLVPVSTDVDLFSLFNIDTDDSVPHAPKTKTVNKNFFSN
jgi:hypothetical protein